jgi:PAS domain S-box-containing protein
MASFSDVTERKQAENALRESEMRYRSLFENMLSGSAYCKILFDDGSPRDFIYLEVNSAFEKLTGLKNVVGRKVSDVIPGIHKSNPELLQFYGRVALTGKPERFEMYVEPLAIWFSVSVYSPEKEYFVAVFDNITERKHANDELRRYSEEIRDLYDNAPCGYHSLAADGTFMRINDTELNWLGYTSDDLVGKKNFGDLMTLESREVFKINYPILKERGWIKDVEYQLIRRDGTILPVILNATAIKDSEGNFLMSRASLFDNTERKQTEVTRKGLEERLQRAEKMESLGMLAGGVAHDLNNALGILIGYSELIDEEIDKSSPIRPHIKYIRQGGERAATIVQDLLTLARRGVQTREIIKLNTVITDAVKSPEFEKILSYHPGVRIKINLDAGLLNIKGSSVHLRKTLMNLISNAAEAMKAGGLLTVVTCNEYVDRPVRGYDAFREGDYVVLTVSDTGEGVSASDMKRIFEPFYSKKSMGRSGTGLGLAVVWGTVKDHSGYINVDSEEGKGTTFTLYFPVTREDISGDQTPISVSEYLGNREIILIVDDLEGQRELANRMLKRLNYEVVVVSGGEEAVKYLEKSKADLVILDMIMDPGMDGLDTYKKILEIHPRQKAIIVSGFAETERVRQAQELGAGAYVKKPYVLEQLGLAVRRELENLSK